MRVKAGLAAVGLLAFLAACSSLPMAPAERARAIDPLHDDLAHMLVAFDLPERLEPAPGGSTLTLAINSASNGERRVVATLAQADDVEMAASLPPPAAGRDYYLFALAPEDREAVIAAQRWAATLPAGTGRVVFAVNPGLCRTDTVDLNSTTVSALVATPTATRLAPLFSNTPLSAVLATAPIKDIPACAGHSG